MTNDMNINIGNSIAGPLEITCPDAKATPAVSSWVTGIDLIHTSWKGTSDTSGDKIPVFKFGTGSDQISAELPVRVKVMKKRTVKVGVYPVTQYPALDTVPLPDNAALTYHLNQVFAAQVNAWMDVKYQPQVFIPFASSSNSLAATNGVTDKEDDIVAEIEARTDAKDFDIIIIMIHDVNYGFADPPYYIRGRGRTLSAKTAIVVTSTPTEGLTPPEKVMRTTAHEIGHIMTGQLGHPDIEEGAAPLKGTDRSQRLMCTGDNRHPNGKLLVKAEWDQIENWLNIHIPEL